MNDDRVYPSAKPAANGANNAPAPAPAAFPATKAQLYNASRPAYRPQPRRSRRSCCCRCCLWTTFFIVLLLLLAAIAGGVVWVIYRPHRPNFSLSTFQISQFNLTSSDSHLTSAFNLTLIARNPNKKLVFFYDPISLSISTDDGAGVDVADGAFPAFTHSPKNTTSLRATIGRGGQSVDEASATALKSDLKKSGSLALKMELDTKVRVKMGSLKTKKVPVRVTCTGIKAAVPTGKAAAAPASTGKAKCKVDLRIKIWKWTL